MRCYKTSSGPAVFRLTEHMKRLENSAKLYSMPMPYKVDELVAATKKLISANKLDACYIRPIVWRGYGEMGLNPLKAPVEAAIAVWPWGTYLGEEGLKNGIKVKISSIRRIEPNILPPKAKATGAYINSILAKLESLDAGYDEAILLDVRGLVSEGPGENLFIVKDGVLKTPTESSSILAGITRQSVITLAKDMDIEFKECDISRDMLGSADEAFFTGTAAELTPIRQIDTIEIGKPGPITKKLQDKFFEVVAGKDKKYKSWLEAV
ncbi:MAG: branched-chain amino acid transaminase [Candidatus Altiarchaeota archaeon]